MYIDFQDNKRYSFPITLNMKEFCESSSFVEEDQDYELFSVVIHGYVKFLQFFFHQQVKYT